jgi:hypothetical protein
MEKGMKRITVSTLLLTVLFSLIYANTHISMTFPLAITFGTTFYHFGMRLLIGGVFDKCMKNKADYSKKWYQLRIWEMSLYDKLKVKKWKNKMPTYKPELLSPKEHTWDEIAQAMCQAELVHETIIIFSFVPILFSIIWRTFWVFFITSILAALFDLSFVIMQRYNRPRVVKIALKEKENEKYKK